MMKSYKTVVIILGMGLFALLPRSARAACAEPSFLAPSSPDAFAAGTNPQSVAVGDFNGDGIPDLAVANNVSNNVSVLLGTGTGSFGAATNFVVGSYPQSMAVGDFNGDRKADLATAHRWSNDVSVLLGDGAGSFGAATNFAVSSPSSNNKPLSFPARAVRGGLSSVVGMAATPLAARAQLKCQQAKLKAQGRLRLCLKRNAAGIIGGKTDASADCQTKFQTALTKADTKATAAGTSCRYMDNGDGTVSDLNTGLVWEQKTTTVGRGEDYTNAHDVDNRYIWSTGSPWDPTGSAFTNFLYKLNGGTSPDGVSTSGCFTGNCDWRLPTIEELQGILLSSHPCGTNPCIDSAFGPMGFEPYMSASTNAGAADASWKVFFPDGLVSNSYKGGDGHVRAVHGGL